MHWKWSQSKKKIQPINQLITNEKIWLQRQVIFLTMAFKIAIKYFGTSEFLFVVFYDQNIFNLSYLYILYVKEVLITSRAWPILYSVSKEKKPVKCELNRI